ncbi:MAG TPA: SPOR domain-containing protein [Pseudomonadales bacterium]|jgi:DedD protein|nr:SPOR domain-containing protein [Pseudomonadales bacterium]HMW15326.1 SPOR domain-containing protein [Pseudomonadales bacterium]HMW83561.1 SPOR domain-containing protein [Pseudomonadales bacterium]HMY97257.1 SPOR domain-containing protein [Pseudomonadales bacterium]HMZ92746.1 SPOR domain-containing protein [Pseudomonadales bacterium]
MGAEQDEKKIRLELRRRLLGALVLVALVVIFLPGLLEQTRYQPDRARFQIPPPPERAQWAPGTPLVNEAELREKLAAGPPSTVGPVPEQDGPPSTLDQQGLPIAWVAQLGDHADSQSAAQWLARVQALGFDAHLQPLQRPNGTRYLLYAGPFWHREQAEAAAQRLRNELKLEPKVVRYQP